MTKRNGRRQRIKGFDEPLPAPVFVGLDLSLRFCCAVAVPGNWQQDFSRCKTMRTGESLRKDAAQWERTRRLERIEADVVAFLRRVKADHVTIEQYALRAPRTDKEAAGALTQAHALGELGGVVKLAIQRDLKLPFDVVAPATARALLKSPRKDAKEWCAKRLQQAGAPHHWIGPSEDRYGIFDAFELANHALATHGHQAILVQDDLFRRKQTRYERHGPNNAD